MLAYVYIPNVSTRNPKSQGLSQEQQSVSAVYAPSCLCFFWKDINSIQNPFIRPFRTSTTTLPQAKLSRNARIYLQSLQKELSANRVCSSPQTDLDLNWLEEQTRVIRIAYFSSSYRLIDFITCILS